MERTCERWWMKLKRRCSGNKANFHTVKVVCSWYWEKWKVIWIRPTNTRKKLWHIETSSNLGSPKFQREILPSLSKASMSSSKYWPLKIKAEHSFRFPASDYLLMPCDSSNRTLSYCCEHLTAHIFQSSSQCKIGGSHDGHYESYCILWGDTLWSGRNSSKMDLYVSLNQSTFLPDYMVSHPKSQQASQ